MAVTTIFILVPFALVASVIYSYLFVKKYGLYGKIKNVIIKKLLTIITYIIIIIVFTIILSIIGMWLFLGIVGLPCLIILDIIGIRRIIKLKSILKNNIGNL
jgi:hypothetical protein